MSAGVEVLCDVRWCVDAARRLLVWRCSATSAGVEVQRDVLWCGGAAWRPLVCRCSTTFARVEVLHWLSLRTRITTARCLKSGLTAVGGEDSSWK